MGKKKGMGMFLKTAALVGATDYVSNGEFTLVGRARDWISGRTRRSSYPLKIQERIDQARGNFSVASQPHGKISPDGRVPNANGGHWIKKMDGSEDATIQRMIHDDFPRERVASLLRRMRTVRGRKGVARELGVAEAQIPALYEWLCAMAWFWISDRVYDVRASIGVGLDERHYPVSCAGAGHGDIVVNYRHGDAILIEASLMNLNNQRRNEWEPTIRHSANLAAELRKEVRTIFVAPKLDTNTVNIWRGVASSTVTASDGTSVRCRILPITSDTLADWVEGGVTSSRIEEIIDETYRQEVARNFDMDWWEKVIASV